MRNRGRIRLHEALEGRLATYAVAASAAGLGLSMTSQPAAARIVYTKANEKLTSTPYTLDLNHDGIADFKLMLSQTEFFFAVTVKPEQSNRIAGYCRELSCREGWASALHERVKVGQNQRLGPYDLLVRGESCNGLEGGPDCWGYGPWVNVTRRYLGLEFVIDGRVHYGWARLNVQVGNPITAVLTGYAYETVPNKPIITGKIKGPDVITLEPGSLGRLAQGSAGRLGK